MSLSYLLPIFKLPSLPQDGLYAVTFQDFEWTDQSRPIWIKPWLDEIEEEEAERRHLFVRIYYPVDKDLEKSVKKAEYYPHVNHRGPAQAAQFKLPGYLLDHFVHVNSNAIKDDKVLSVVEGGKFPLIIFSHGYSGSHDQNSILLMRLVSMGYIVASMDHTHDASITVLPGRDRQFLFNSAPKESWNWEGRDVAHDARHRHLMMRSHDLRFVLNQLVEMDGGRLDNDLKDLFKGRIDLDNVGLLGHSFGGGTVVGTLDDSRIKCAMAMDAWTWALSDDQLKGGDLKPWQKVLFVQAKDWYSPDTEWGKYNDVQVDYLAQVSKGWHFRLNNAKHFDFTDVGLYSPFLTKKLGLTNLPGDFMQDLIFDLAKEFFARFLKGEGGSDILEDPGRYYSNLYPYEESPKEVPKDGITKEEL